MTIWIPFLIGMALGAVGREVLGFLSFVRMINEEDSTVQRMTKLVGRRPDDQILKSWRVVKD